LFGGLYNELLTREEHVLSFNCLVTLVLVSYNIITPLAPKDTSLEGTLDLDKPPYCISVSTNTLIKLSIVEPSTTLYKNNTIEIHFQALTTYT
jgi:hypothetical protein